MSPKELMHLWRSESGSLTQARSCGAWLEITLPFSTLSDKFIRVFVQEQPNGAFLLSDLGDLADDTYEVGEDSRAFATALDLVDRKVFRGEGYCLAGAVYWLVIDEDLVGAALFELAQLLQLAVNLAVLSQKSGPVSAGAVIVTHKSPG